MTVEEFFVEQFNKCIWVEDDDRPGNIYMLFDKYHERKMKVSSILENKNKIEFIKNEDTIVLFYQDHKNGYLDCNYDKIWRVLEEEYGLGYKETEDLISGILDDYTKLNGLTPLHSVFPYIQILDGDKKLNILTPIQWEFQEDMEFFNVKKQDQML